MQASLKTLETPRWDYNEGKVPTIDSRTQQTRTNDDITPKPTPHTQVQHTKISTRNEHIPISYNY